jgi:hypothetical protein
LPIFNFFNQSVLWVQYGWGVVCKGLVCFSLQVVLFLVIWLLVCSLGHTLSQSSRMSMEQRWLLNLEWCFFYSTLVLR